MHFVDSELLTQVVQEREYCVCDIAVYVQQRSPALQFVSSSGRLVHPIS
jgi:hypothetical protein